MTPERVPMKILRTSTVIWHDTDGDKPGRDELVLAQHQDGNHYILMWLSDDNAWHDPGFGPIDRDAVIAWARLPMYEAG